MLPVINPLRNSIRLGRRAEDVPQYFTRNSVACLSDGTQVATNVPRLETGKFGKAIMVEEGTTNLFTNPKLLNNGQDWTPNSSTAWVDSSGEYPYIHCETQWDGVYQTLSLSATTYTLTYLVKHKSGSNQIGSHFDGSSTRKIRVDGGEWINDSIITVPSDGNWHLVEIQATYTTAGSYNVYLQPGRGVVGVSEFWFKYAQLEAKPYATSFIDGTRAAETLLIPTAGVLNPQEGTVDIVYQINSITSLTDNVWLFSFATSTSPLKNILGIKYYKGNPQIWAYDNNGSGGVYSYNTATSIGWHMCTLRWNTQEIALFLDGVKIISHSNPNLPTILPSVCYIGSFVNGVFQFNSLIDDLRISNIARSDAEIAEAYKSNMPLLADEWTTAIL